MNVTNDPSSFIWILQTANCYAKLPISYNGWIGYEPNNVGGYEYCFILTQDVGYMWMDIHCGEQCVSVCEIDIA